MRPLPPVLVRNMDDGFLGWDSSRMTKPRVLAWVSGGAASIVAAKMAISLYGEERVHLVRCETSNEDDDNARFEREACNWLGKEVTLLRSDKYESVWDVWEKRRFMAGPSGAACTMYMKVQPRLAFQRPTDIHVFGYTADTRDAQRFAKLKSTYFELTVRAPLVEAGVTKAATLQIVRNAGIRLPRSYELGFPNANCLATGCVKASSPSYWALFRKHFPDRFERMASLSRDIGKRLVSIRGQRMFLDELPPHWPVTQPIAAACDFLCSHAESEMSRQRVDPAPIRRPLVPSSEEGVRHLRELLKLDNFIPEPLGSLEDDRYITIKIARRRNPKMRCPKCGSKSRANGARRVFYADLPLRGKPTRLQWDRQRFLCCEPTCGKSFSDTDPALHPTRQMTQRLLRYIGEGAMDRPFAAVADECGLAERTIAGVTKEWLASQPCPCSRDTKSLSEIEPVETMKSASDAVEGKNTPSRT